jgi:DNA-binding transcriptional ArsR family regulator
MAHLHFSQSLVSHHLKDLKNADIVDFRKEKNKVYYILTGRGKDLANLLFNTNVIASEEMSAAIFPF